MDVGTAISLLQVRILKWKRTLGREKTHVSSKKWVRVFCSKQLPSRTSTHLLFNFPPERPFICSLKFNNGASLFPRTNSLNDIKAHPRKQKHIIQTNISDPPSIPPLLSTLPIRGHRQRLSFIFQSNRWTQR